MLVIIIVVQPITILALDSVTRDQMQFTHTKMHYRSPMMWAHVTLAFLFLPLGIFFMRRFSLKLHRQVSTSAHTLMISRVPRAACFRENMIKHFEYVDNVILVILLLLFFKIAFVVYWVCLHKVVYSNYKTWRDFSQIRHLTFI